LEKRAIKRKNNGGSVTVSMRLARNPGGKEEGKEGSQRRARNPAQKTEGTAQVHRQLRVQLLAERKPQINVREKSESRRRERKKAPPTPANKIVKSG